MHVQYASRGGFVWPTHCCPRSILYHDDNMTYWYEVLHTTAFCTRHQVSGSKKQSVQVQVCMCVYGCTYLWSTQQSYTYYTGIFFVQICVHDARGTRVGVQRASAFVRHGTAVGAFGIIVRVYVPPGTFMFIAMQLLQEFYPCQTIREHLLFYSIINNFNSDDVEPLRSVVPKESAVFVRPVKDFFRCFRNSVTCVTFFRCFQLSRGWGGGCVLVDRVYMNTWYVWWAPTGERCKRRLS